MDETKRYYLLLSPDQDELVGLVHRIAHRLLGTAAEGWSDPVAESGAGGANWVTSQNGIELRMAEPSTRQGDAKRWGSLELSGFPDGGKIRWVMAEPGKMELCGLSDADVDFVWGLMREQQASAVHEWVRSKKSSVSLHEQHPRRGGFRSLFRALVPDEHDTRAPLKEELPRVAQPPFAPEDFPRWLYRGELSSLPRHVKPADVIVAGVALESDPSQRLIVRPLQRMGSQTIVPLTMLRRGHRFVGGVTSVRGFESARAVAKALVEPLGRYAGVPLDLPKTTRTRETESSALYVARWSELEQFSRQPFEERIAISKLPRSSISIRLLEVRSRFAGSHSSAMMELVIDGLEGDTQLIVTGRRGDETPYQVLAFALGEADRAEDVMLLAERALR